MGLLPVTAAKAAGGASLTVVDYRAVNKLTKPAGANGLMSTIFDPVPPGCFWLVERITVSTTSSTTTRAMVYAGDPGAGNFVDGTEHGNLDTADESAPILLESSLSLNVLWTGASVGAQGTVRIQYQLVQRG